MIISLFTILALLVASINAEGCGSAGVNVLYEVVSQCALSSFCWSYVNEASSTKFVISTEYLSSTVTDTATSIIDILETSTTLKSVEEIDTKTGTTTDTTRTTTATTTTTTHVSTTTTATTTTHKTTIATTTTVTTEQATSTTTTITHPTTTTTTIRPSTGGLNYFTYTTPGAALPPGKVKARQAKSSYCDVVSRSPVRFAASDISSACNCYVSRSPPIYTLNETSSSISIIIATVTSDTFTVEFIETDTLTNIYTSTTEIFSTLTPTTTATSTEIETSTGTTTKTTIATSTETDTSTRINTSTTVTTVTATGTSTTTTVTTTTKQVAPTNTCSNFVKCPPGTTSGFQLMAYGFPDSENCMVGQVGTSIESGQPAGSPYIYYSGLLSQGGAKFSLDAQNNLVYQGVIASTHDTTVDYPVYFDGGPSVNGDPSTEMKCEIVSDTSEFVCTSRGGTTFGYLSYFGGDTTGYNHILTTSPSLSLVYEYNYIVYLSAHCGP